MANKRGYNNILDSYKMGSAKKVISEIVNRINITSDYSKEIENTKSNRNTKTQYGNFITDDLLEACEKNILKLTKELFEELAKKWDLEINEGTILNISVSLIKFIKENNLKLEYNEETDEIFGYNPEDKYYLVQFDIKLKPEGLQVAMNKPGNGDTETSILVTLNRDTLKGYAYDPKLKCYNEFNIEFKENGLLNTKEYKHNIFLSKEWPKGETPTLHSKTTYHKEAYQTREKLIKNGEIISSFCYPDSQYLDTLNKMIDEVPGFISVWHEDLFEEQTHQIMNVESESIKTVFDKIWKTAETDIKVKKLIKN